MISKATTPDKYVDSLPADRKEVIAKLRKEIKKNLPKGFAECMSYGMIGYVVPHSLYAEGYHCDPELPLPFINIASQKNYVSFYHMGLYGDTPLTKWFTKEYEKLNIGKLDMGKCCVRFKKMENIPYKLLGELSSRLTPQDWIDIYEKMKPKKNGSGTARGKKTTNAR